MPLRDSRIAAIAGLDGLTIGNQAGYWLEKGCFSSVP